MVLTTVLTAAAAAHLHPGEVPHNSPHRQKTRGGGVAKQLLRCELIPIPDATRHRLEASLGQRRRERWPELASISVRTRGIYAYVAEVTADRESLPLCRLRYFDTASWWGFSIYLASKEGYEPSVLPRGTPTGTTEEALNCACGLYLGDPTTWLG